MPKAAVTISRDSRNVVRIELIDRASRIRFAEVKLTLEDYAMLITGLGQVEGEVDYRDLEHVGKKRITEERTATFPGKSYRRAELEQWLVENCQEEGWILNPYLGSQTSISHTDKGMLLLYSVSKYVKEEGV